MINVKLAVWMILLLVMIQSVVAITSTILTPKIVLRANSTGEYYLKLGVRNDNEFPIVVEVTGYEPPLFIDNPMAELRPNESYSFQTYYNLTTPINKTFSLSVGFSGPPQNGTNQYTSLTAKWVLLSEFDAPEPSITPEVIVIPSTPNIYPSLTVGIAIFLIVVLGLVGLRWRS
jgi:hypothetical protein